MEKQKKNKSIMIKIDYWLKSIIGQNINDQFPTLQIGQIEQTKDFANKLYQFFSLLSVQKNYIKTLLKNIN